MTWIDPYHRLGLRCNPFLAEQVPGVPDHLWLDRGFSQAPVPKSRMLLQIIGEKGAGKTSHLLHWRQQTGGQYAYYPPEILGRVQWPPGGAIAYWDEADRIPEPLLLVGLTFAKAQGSTIVAGTHKSLNWAAKIVGLRVQTIRLSCLTIAELRDWTTQRIEAVRLTEAASVRLDLSDEVARSIVQQSGASWRKAATLLHIWAAQCANKFS
ncbi:hypothetical protein [Phormidesmis priestleyi]